MRKFVPASSKEMEGESTVQTEGTRTEMTEVIHKRGMSNVIHDGETEKQSDVCRET